jgi:hypothetical protein
MDTTPVGAVAWGVLKDYPPVDRPTRLPLRQRRSPRPGTPSALRLAALCSRFASAFSRS